MDAIVFAPLILGIAILYILTPFIDSIKSGLIWLIIGVLCLYLFLPQEGLQEKGIPGATLMVITGLLLCFKKRDLAYFGWLAIITWLSILLILWWGIPGAILTLISLSWSLNIKNVFKKLSTN